MKDFKKIEVEQFIDINGEWNKLYTAQEAIDNLQEKINKALEYIKSQQIIFKDYDIVIENQLKNIEFILKGDE